MTPITWFLLADTIVTSAALVLAALAWWRVGGYMRQCRSCMQAVEPIVKQHDERHTDHGERWSPLLADRITEDTQEIDPVDEPVGCGSCGDTDPNHVCDDPHPTGRHALPPMTEVMPATGDLDDPDIVRPYVRAATSSVPRYAFAELQRQEATR